MKEKKILDPMKRKNILKIAGVMFLETTAGLLGADAYRQYQEGNTAAAIVEGTVAAGAAIAGLGEFVSSVTAINNARKLNKAIGEVVQITDQIVENGDIVEDQEVLDDVEE